MASAGKAFEFNIRATPTLSFAKISGCSSSVNRTRQVSFGCPERLVQIFGVPFISGYKLSIILALVFNATRGLRLSFGQKLNSAGKASDGHDRGHYPGSKMKKCNCH